MDGGQRYLLAIFFRVRNDTHRVDGAITCRLTFRGEKLAELREQAAS